MKIKTKYNIGDTLFVPLIDSSEFVFAQKDSGKTIGVYIKKAKVEFVTVGKEIIYNFDCGVQRPEAYVFDSEGDAKKYALTMIDFLAEKNRERINNFNSTL